VQTLDLFGRCALFLAQGRNTPPVSRRGTVYGNRPQRSLKEEETLPDIVRPARRALGMFAVLASLFVSTVPIERALAQQQSSSVLVVNPATSPLPTSRIDSSGRSAYQSAQTTTACAGSTSCVFNFPPVPKGHHLVVQHVSGSLIFSGSGSLQVFLGEVQAQTRGASNPTSSFFAPSINGISLFDQPVLHYVAGGIGPTVSLSTSFPGSSSSGTGVGKSSPFTTDNQSITLTGYLIDCKSGPCKISQ
jgi:hypothetical protein